VAGHCAREGPGVQKTPGAGEKKRFPAPAQVVMASQQRPAQAEAQVLMEKPLVLPGVMAAVPQVASGR
jgi:hypothetical protein